jgi:predicted dehydrogenase
VRGTRVKLALVGCGEVALHKHLPALRRLPAVEIAAVADPDETRRNLAGTRFGIARRYAELETLLEQVDVDAVGVCVPPARHLEVALAAMRAGKHVWIDEPLALDRGGCAALLEQARRSQGQVMVGFHMRFHRLIRAALPLIRGGALGQIESVRSLWNSPRRDEGIPSWRRTRVEGGGALTEIGSHHYDLWRFLLRSEVKEVFARSRDGARDDEAAVVSAVMENGVLAAAVLSERAGHAVEIEIAGDRGRLRLDLLRFDGFEFDSSTDVSGRPGTRLRHLRQFLGALPAGLVTAFRTGSDYLDSYRAAWSGFVNGITRGEPAEPTLEDGVRATEILCAAVGSRAAGRPMPVGAEA